jgi:hypothetical protein
MTFLGKIVLMRRCLVMNDKEVYKITINGCDDYTEFVMNLTDDEAILLQKLSTLSRTYSSYPCQPTLTIEPTNNSYTIN